MEERDERRCRARLARDGDALRSLNTRSSARAPPSPAPRPPLSVPLCRRARPSLRLSPRPAPLNTMDVYSHRMSWGAGLLSPLSPNTIDSLEARSRDVQERTFCKWYRIRLRPCHLCVVLRPSLARLNTKLEANGYPPMTSLVRDLSDGVRLIQLMVSTQLHPERASLFTCPTRSLRKSWVRVIPSPLLSHAERTVR